MKLKVTTGCSIILAGDIHTSYNINRQGLWVILYISQIFLENFWQGIEQTDDLLLAIVVQ